MTDPGMDDLLDRLSARVGDDDAHMLYGWAVFTAQFSRAQAGEGDDDHGEMPGARVADVKGRLVRVLELSDGDLRTYVERARAGFAFLAAELRREEAEDER